MIIKPEEVIEISIENSKDKVERCLLEIQEKIIGAASRGDFSTSFNGYKYPSGFINYISRILSIKGYITRCVNSVIEISWYEPKIKQTLSIGEKKEENNKQNKSVQKSDRDKTVRKDSSISPSSEG